MHTCIHTLIFLAMKKSIYSTELSLSDRLVLFYNALTDSFVVAKRKEGESMEELRKKYVQSLIDGGFFVEDSVDESEVLQSRLRTVLNDKRAFHLTINPTLECNFSCWYCYEEKKKGTIMSEDTIMRLFLFIRKSFKDFDLLKVSFFGGEPFLAFERIILPTIKNVARFARLYDKAYEISFTTNGSLLTDSWISALKEFNICGFQITLDGDKDCHDRVRFFNNRAGSYKTIVQNICKLLQARICVILRINYTPESIASINSVVTDILSMTTKEMRSLLTINLQQVWQTRSTDLTAEIKRIVKQIETYNINVEEPVFNYINSPCYADLRHSAVINYNGDVYKCTAVDFLNVRRDGYLSSDGVIYWENNSNERRLEKRMNPSTICTDCRIQPLCNGGCSQSTLKIRNDSSCPLNLNKEQKDRIVLERFSQALRTNDLFKAL